MSSCSALIVRQDPCLVCFKPINADDVEVPLCEHKFHQKCLDILSINKTACPTCELGGSFNPFAGLRSNDRSLKELVAEYGKTIQAVKMENDTNKRRILVMNFTMKCFEKILVLNAKGTIHLHPVHVVALSVMHSSFGLATFIASELSNARAPQPNSARAPQPEVKEVP